MELVGKLFRPKTSFDVLKNELVPSFNSVLVDWINNVKRIGFADPNYVLEITYVTPPLRMFIERIVERLDTIGIIGGPLERGFGFGKTHSLIFLWHLFTSSIHEKIGINRDIVKETLVLGMDCSKDKPLTRIVEELKIYAKARHPSTHIKDPQLLRAVAEVLRKYENKLYGLTSRELAMLIADIMKRYEELGGTPRLLLLIDEMGWGFAQKIRDFAEKIKEGKKSEAESIYNEANNIVNFLSYLYARLHDMHIRGVVVWVLAQQDYKEIDALAKKYVDDKVIYSKIVGLLEDLNGIAERYSRGLGGTGLAELSYSPEHALEIARYRILKVVENKEFSILQNEYIDWLENIARQLNLTEVFTRYRDELKRYYPFSLGLINLLKKLMRPTDVPVTEFVRTVIEIASEAARKALNEDPEGTYTIGVKHLTIPGVVQSKLMGKFGSDWADAAGDIEYSLSNIEPDIRETAEIATKYILAKGVTANILAALESREQRIIEQYGSTIDEIQLEIIESFTESKAFQIIEKLDEALDKLRAESARIEEREVGGKRYYLPSLFKTVYNKLASYILEEKKNLENKALIPIYIRQTGTIPSLFTNVKATINGRSGDVVTVLLEYRKVKDVETLLSDVAFREAQNNGKLLLVIIPPWDIDLFKEIYNNGKNYDDIVNNIVEKLQFAVKQGKVKRPLHVVVLLPDLSPTRMSKLLDRLATHEGTKKFLEYLSKKENVINERIREYEGVLIKRKDLLSILGEEAKKKHLKELRSRLEREIIDAKNFAQKQLVKLSREIVIDVIGLYRKAVYYSIDKYKFTSKDIIIPEDVEKGANELGEGITLSSLSNYASIVNKFLSDVIKNLAYEYDIMKITNVVLKAYKKEFEQGSLRERDRIEEILENIMLGTYGIKPLSLDVAQEAVKYLNNQIIELDDKNIKISVNENTGFIEFHVEFKQRKEEIEEIQQTQPSGITSIGVSITKTLSPEQVIQHIFLELPPGFNVEDVRSRLTTLMNLLRNLKTEISSIEFKLETSSVSLNTTLKKPTHESLMDVNVKTIMNLLSRISYRENNIVSMEIRLSKPVAEDNVRKVFGEYLKTRHSSFDRFLAT